MIESRIESDDPFQHLIRTMFALARKQATNVGEFNDLSLILIFNGGPIQCIGPPLNNINPLQ